MKAPLPARLDIAKVLSQPGAARVIALLNSDGEEARIVGGAVRNALLQLPVTDIDIATTAPPEIVMQRARAAGLKAIPTGIDHGTVTLVTEGAAFEVTSLREDIETDGRHAKVRFGRDFRADALRRDFTINALSADAQGNVYDYGDGLADLAVRKIRFIGDARQRIREDYLRILRLFRFHAQYGEGEIDRAGFDAAIAGRAGLEHLSRERIGAEILKLLGGRRAADACAAMSDGGLLARLLGGAPNPARLARLTAIEAALRLPGDGVLRLAALAVMIAEDAEHLRDVLRLANSETKRLTGAADALAQLHARASPPAPGDLRAFLFLHGRRAACDASLLAHSESGAPPDDGKWQSAHCFLRDTPEPQLPFSGAQLLARGLSHGPAIGRVLKSLQARWIRAGFPQEPALLARLMDEALTSDSPRAQ